MLVDFCMSLREARIPVSTREFLVLLDALAKGVVGPSLDEFHALARCTLVKDESLFDRFDRAFAKYVERRNVRTGAGEPGAFQGIHAFIERAVGERWRHLHGATGWDVLVDLLRQAFLEQRKSDAASPALHAPPASDVPRGALSGPSGGGGASAWDARLFREYDHSAQLGTRNMKVALRRLRRFAHEGPDDQFDLDATIRATAQNAGWLDIRTGRSRTNKVKVLLLMDVGGSMDEHVARVQELFSAARSEFKRLEFYYFHNCVYEHVWRHDDHSEVERTSTWDLIRKFGDDHVLLFVGDATMSPSELLNAGGGIASANQETGQACLQRLLSAFPRHAWINPEPEAVWHQRPTIGMVRKLVNQRMVPLTVHGIEQGMRLLSR